MITSREFCVSTTKPCTNLKVEWISKPGLIVPCDGDECLKFAIDPDAPTHCLEGFILCEDCDSCGVKYFKECFCVDGVGCPDGYTCSDEGICIPICTQEQLAAGLIPTNLGCGCPINTPIFDPLTNKCAECISGTIDGCKICVNGYWQVVNCPDGKCKELPDGTPKCVECINSGDCANKTDGRNCCNPDTNACGCCPGFVWDFGLKKCVEAPECTEDGTGDLECKQCIDGKYQLLPGWILVNGICVYSPCGNKPCENAFDCESEDCGCPDTTKICTGCEQDPTGRGCEENNCGGTCTGDNCADGCGCWKGECVPCSYLTPEQQAVTPGCNGDKACVDNFDSKIVGCNLETTLATNEPCACPVLTSALTNGNFTTAYTYQNPGSQVVILTPTRSSLINTVNFKSNFTFELRKGIATDYPGFLSLPTLDDITSELIAHNELPENGTITLELVAGYKTETSIGSFGPTTYTTLPSIAASIVDKTKVTFENVSIRTSQLVSQPASGQSRGLYQFLTSLQVRVKYNSLSFPNTCNYGSAVVFEKTYIASTSTIDGNPFSEFYNSTISINKIKTNGNSLPLFVYKRSKTTTFTNTSAIRKVYVPKINGTYKDVLFGPGCVEDEAKYPLVSPEFGLYSGYNYLVSTTCTCTGIKEKLVTPIVCEDISPNILLEDCNTKVTIDPIVPTCAINKNLTNLLGSCSFPADAQVYYKLYINDVFIKNLLPEDVASYVKTVPEGITNIKITHSHDESCIIFEQDYSSVAKDPTYTIDCKVGNYADIVFSQVVSPGVTITKATNLSNFNEYVAVNGVVKLVNVTKGTSINVKLEFSDGCVQTVTVIVDCCDALTLTASMNNNGKICNSVPVEVTFSSSNGYGTLQYYVNNTLLFSPTYTVTTAGSYTAKVVDANGCEKEIEVVVGECTDVVLTNNPTLICTSENSLLKIEGDPSATVVLQYPNLTTTTVTLDVNGVWEQTVSSDGTYEILTYNGVSMTGVTSELNVVSTPTLASITAVSSACEDTSVSFTFTGTPGATIVVNFGFGSPVTLTIGNGGTVTHSVSYTNAGAYTVDVTAISVGGNCSSDPGITHAITIVEKPNIVIGNTTCDLLGNTASTAVTVTPTSATLSIISGSGTVSGASGNFFVDSDLSETIVVRANNGGCLTEATIIINCNCPAIIAPPANDGVICATYDSMSGNYIYTITTEPEVTTMYNTLFDAMATYNAVDYPMAYSNYAATLSTLPLDYDLNDPDILVTIEDLSTGCTDTITITPTINVAPIVNISGPATLCVGVESTFTSNTTGSATGYTYTWHVIKDSIVQTVTSNTNPTFKYTAAGPGSVFEIYLTMTKDGCTTTSNSLIYSAQTCCSTLTISTSGNTINSCSDITLTSTGTAPFSWSWTPTGTLSETQTSLVNNIIDANDEAPGASGTYQITVTDANGCTGALTLPYSRSSVTSVSIPFNSFYNYNAAVAVVFTYIKVTTCANVDHILWSAGASYPNEECVVKNDTACTDSDLITNTYGSGIPVDIPTMISHANTALALIVPSSTFSYDALNHALVLTSDCDNIKKLTINGTAFLSVNGSCQMANPQNGSFPSASFNC